MYRLIQGSGGVARLLRTRQDVEVDRCVNKGDVREVPIIQRQPGLSDVHPSHVSWYLTAPRPNQWIPNESVFEVLLISYYITCFYGYEMSFYVSTVQPGSITMMVRKMIKIPFLPAVPAVPAEISTLTFNITDNVMKEDVC